MVVKLYTTDGKIRIYKTHYSTGGGDSGPVEFVTGCGMKWKKEPELYQTCSHIDCAIEVQKQAVVELLLILLFLIPGSALFIPITSRDILIKLLAVFLILIAYLIAHLFVNRKKSHQLEEYKRNGTIDGISAYSDPALDNLIRALDRAIRLNPQSTALLNDKDIGLKALNIQVMAAVDRAIGFDPQIADAWYLKGMALHGQNKYDEAIIAYEKAAEAYEKAT